MLKTALGFDFLSVVPISRQAWNRGLTKTLLVMKLTILLITVALFQVRASSVAQTVTLSGKDLTLKQVFSAIEKQTGFVLLNKKGTFDDAKPVTLTVYEMPLRDLLDVVLKNQALEYEIQGKTILLSRKSRRASQGYSPVPDEAELVVPAEPINGLVRDADGKPLAGVSIVVKNSNKGTMTNGKGEFSIHANTGDVLSFSYIGYEAQQLRVNGPIVLIVLKLSPSVLDETQITAYGKTSKRLATGNIGTIKGEDIARQPAMTIFEAIAGRVPGVVITPKQGNSAAPVSIEIRGRNTINPFAIQDPLYVIDGIPLTVLNTSPLTGNETFSTGAVQGGRTNTVGENPLLSINPKDIESIDILKDADATAIYGSRGANGVILITTKRGKSGPTKFDISINNGFRSIQKYPKLLTTEEYLAVRKEAFRNDGIVPDFDNAPDLVVWDQKKYTDWQRVFGSSGNDFSVNAGISGGMAQTSYSISANYTSSTQIMNNGGKNKRGTLNSTLNHSSRDQKFSVNIGTNLALTDVESYSGIGGLSSIAPNAPDIYNENGDFNFEPYRGRDENKLPFTELKRPSFSETFSLQSNIKLKYEILNGLSISTVGGYNFSFNENKNLIPVASLDPLFSSASSAYFGNTSNKGYTLEPQLQYTTFIGKGNLSVQLIGSIQEVKTRGNTLLGEGFPNDNMLKSINNATGKTIVEGYAEYRYTSAASIIRYSWDNKYILNLNARRDGSSKFGPGKQFGNFGSVGAAWIASDEKWVKAIMPEWFSFFKLRGSYGITGGDGIGDYEYLSRWANTYTIGGRSIYKYNDMEAFHIVRALNQEFQWESTKKTEIALQLGFLKEKINLDVSYYTNSSSNQITSVPMPEYTGFKNVKANWPANVRNTGIEVGVNARLINSKDWGMNFNFNIGRNWNELISFPGLELSTAYNNRYKIGESLKTQYVLHYIGIDPLTGDYAFEDYNKNGKIDAGGGIVPDFNMTDRYVKMDITPKYSGGFGLNVSYKDVSLVAQFSFVNRLSLDPYLSSRVGSMANLLLPKDILDNHWKNPGDIVKYPKFTTQGVSLAGSDAMYTNGSYLRMSMLSLSYRFPSEWLEKVKVKDVSFSINTNNLFTITSYKGFDPEIPTLSGFAPIPRVVSTSLLFNF